MMTTSSPCQAFSPPLDQPQEMMQMQDLVKPSVQALTRLSSASKVLEAMRRMQNLDILDVQPFGIEDVSLPDGGGIKTAAKSESPIGHQNFRSEASPQKKRKTKAKASKVAKSPKSSENLKLRQPRVPNTQRQSQSKKDVSKKPAATSRVSPWKFV